MAEKIDILMHQGDDAAFFTVDTAVGSVLLQPAVNATPGGFARFQRADGNYSFQNGDNMLILSMGFVLPLGFELDESLDDTGDMISPSIETRVEQTPSGAVITPLPKMFMPLLNNYEISIGNWHEIPDVDPDTGFELWGHLPVVGDILKISMVNVPADFDESIFHVPCFIKISHTLEIAGSS